jgi:hypothetical protein
MIVHILFTICLSCYIALLLFAAILNFRAHMKIMGIIFGSGVICWSLVFTSMYHGSLTSEWRETMPHFWLYTAGYVFAIYCLVAGIRLSRR